MPCYPSLHCYWRRKNYKVCDKWGPTWEDVPYTGPSLPSEYLSEQLKEGFFHGEVFNTLFEALTVMRTKKEVLCYSLYEYVGDHSDALDSTNGLSFVVELLQPIKQKLLASDGEVWLEKFKAENKFLKDSEYKEHYTIEVVLSFIMMFEWYNLQARNELYKGNPRDTIALYCFKTYRQRRVDGKVEYIPYYGTGVGLW